MTDRIILVVDDDPSIRYLVDQVLSEVGYTVRQASNGAEALSVIEGASGDEVPRLIFLDMRMPVLDGWGFAEELRRRELQIPVIVMTAATNARRWATEVGAVGYVEKPFDLDDLIEVADDSFPAPPVGLLPPSPAQAAPPPPQASRGWTRPVLN